MIYDVRKRWLDDVMYSIVKGLCEECSDRIVKTGSAEKKKEG